ncbi:MAG TPA: aminotransferase class I/II-fold pyridoxal phosphate-dependent enzyme [Arcobacter sp.]|nr:aminotransferase class I/II-fold pyridoxal phosphate-dependent enzyme [Arcobacter sp.]
MKEFSHGGQVEQFSKELNCSVDEIIDLSSNINFLKPSIKLDFNTLDISSYPTYDKLYSKIANRYNVDVENIELYNGGSSAIFSLFNHLNLSYCTVYSPAYLEYKKACKIYNYTYDSINRFENITRAVHENSLVVFVNPSTPEGKFYDIEEFLEAWDKLNCTVLIDESFLDFTNFPSVSRYINKYKNLYILKSMTKFYSCAGVRCGTIISSKENIAKLKENEPMWKLSHFDSCYLQEALNDKLFAKTSKAINIKNHLLLKKVLEDSPIFTKVFSSDSNFLLAKLKNIKASTLQEHLKEYKIMIRDCSNFEYLDDSYVRIAVKSEKSIFILKESISRLGLMKNLSA